MRRLAGGLGLALWLLTLAGPAGAEGYLNAVAGVNGIVTAPAEPFMMAYDPPETLRAIPGGSVAAYPLGLVTGTLMMGYQVMMGVLDIAFTPFWVFPTLSPEPRWVWSEDVEYD